MKSLEKLMTGGLVAIHLGSAHADPLLQNSASGVKTEIVSCMTSVDAQTYGKLAQETALAGLKTTVRTHENQYGDALRVERPNGFKRHTAADSEAGVDSHVDFKVSACEDGTFGVSVRDDNFIAFFRGNTTTDLAEKIRLYMDTVSTLENAQAVRVINKNWLGQ